MKLAEIKNKLEAITDDKSASKTLPCLVPHIAKLNKDDLLYLFKTDYFPVPRYKGLIYLIIEIDSDENALLVLNLVEKLPPDYLRCLFPGDVVYTSGHEENDNLMRHIGKFSSSVVTKSLKLLGKLSTSDIRDFLIGWEGDFINPLSPLEIPFNARNRCNPEEQAELAITLIDTLSQDDSLYHLLVNAPRKNSEPFLHLLVRHRVLPAIAHYLKNPALSMNHRNNLGQHALGVAEQMKYDEAICLFNAYPVRHDLGSPIRFRNVFEDRIKKCPGILATRWDGHKTLAHIAIEEKNSVALELMLKNGADANTVDKNQLSILDYAINTNQPDAIRVLATHPKTIFSNVRQNGALPLPELLGKCEQATIKGIINNLRADGSDKEATSFAASLMQLPKARLENDLLKETLNKPASNKSFIENMSAYCNTSDDSLSYFLLNAGSAASTSKNPVLFQAAMDFTKSHLSALANTPSDLEKESRRLQLILFLFAMNTQDMSAFLKQVSLNEAQSQQLDLTICRALTCKLIYSSIAEDSHQKILDCLHDKKKSMKAIASVHFRQSTLALLPHRILQTLSHAISEEKLYQHNKNRKDPILVVLTLTRELEREPSDPAKIAELSKNLESELMRFNEKATASLSELAMMLNFATAPVIQDAIHNFLTGQPPGAPVIKKIDALFTRYRKDQLLVKDGMLKKIIMNYAVMPDKIQALQAHSALRDVISIASRDEVQQIIKHHQQAIQEQLLVNSLSGLVDSSNQNPETAFKCAQELYKLDDTTARISLTPFVNNAVAFSDKIRSLTLKLNTPELDAAKQTLEALANSWSNLAETIVKSQFENTCPAWTDSLESSLAKVQETSRLAVGEIENLVSLSLTTRIQSPILQQLMSTIHELAGSALPEALRQGFKKLDDMEEYRQRSLRRILATNPELHPLQNVLTTQATGSNTSELLIARTNLEKCLKQQIKNFNYSLSHGISKNSELKNLLPDLSAWQMSNGIFVNEASLIKEIPSMLPSSNRTALPIISEQQDAILNLLQKSDNILKDLQKLASTKSSLNDLLDILYAADFDELAQFVLLTAKSQAHDLNRLAHFVQNGKMHHWENALLQKRIAGSAQVPLDSWLPESIKSLTKVASHALSIKAIIAGHYLNDEQCEDRLKEFSILLQAHQIPLEPVTISLFANSHVALLTHQALSSNAILFVEIFSRLMQQSNARLQAETFASLSPEFISQLLEQVLFMVNSNEPTRAASAKFLLTLLSQQAGIEQGERLLLIKKRLGAQDFKLLGNESLAAIAKDVLKEKSSLDDLTYNGVWIQRLLVSPKFVAASPPEILQILTERYRALSLTLKQDEFERNNKAFLKKLEFYNQHHEAFANLEQENAAIQKERTAILEKHKRLLMFRADDSIRALYNYLEDNCFELRETEPELAEMALNNLYTHHNQQLASMRTDGLFRVADFVYSRAMRGQGDLPKAENPLLAWLEKHLPHKNFQQDELARKTSVRLFNEKDQQVGFLDASNHAIAFVNDEPVSLLFAPNCKEGMVLYNEDRCRIGVLTASGQLKRESVFQEQTSALLVGKMSMEELEKSPAALDLLLQDICNENALSILYKAAKGKEKKAWLHQKITKHFKENEHILSEELVAGFVEHHPIESLLDALDNNVQPKNAKNLFKAIFKNDKKRDALLALDKSHKLQAFFKQEGTDEILADFLKEHHSKPWFSKGLTLILKSAPKTGLLAKSLQALSQSTMDSVLQIIINTPTIASAVRQEGSDITRFFKKQHIMSVVKTLNEKESWQKCPQYELLLMILKAEHKRLFPSAENSLSVHPVWNDEDLQQITAFVTRHIRTKNNHDTDGAIGQRLLGELVFRCANFGQTALFYKKNGKLDARVASSHLQRSTLDALAARYYFNAIRESLENFIARVKNWFAGGDDGKDEHLDEELKGNHAAIDWKALAKASWSHTTGTELPLIAAFLINYTGASRPVSKLLGDILKDRALMKNTGILHHLAQIISHYPHRDISHIIFNALIEEGKKNPGLIDETVLKSLVSFHARAHLHEHGQLEPLEAALSLLTHCGQNKNYALTHHMAKKLHKAYTWGAWFRKLFGYNVSENDAINNLFGRAITEAQVENEMQNDTDSWFPGLKTMLKRWWYYGSDDMKNSTGIVKFYDDETPCPHGWSIPSHIRNLIPGRQANCPGLEPLEDYARTHELYQMFMDKEMAPNETPKESPLPNAPALDMFGLFGKAREMWDMPVPSDAPVAGFI